MDANSSGEFNSHTALFITQHINGVHLISFAKYTLFKKNVKNDLSQQYYLK